MIVRYDEDALQEIDQIAAYYESRDAQVCRRILRDISSRVATIASNPLAGRLQDSPGIWKAVTRQYRYLIYYAIDEGARAVDILGVHHPARDRPHRDK